MTMKKFNHRVTAESKRGRQLTQAKGARICEGYTPQFAEHNKAIDAKNAAKKKIKEDG